MARNARENSQKDVGTHPTSMAFPIRVRTGLSLHLHARTLTLTSIFPNARQVKGKFEKTVDTHARSRPRSVREMEHSVNAPRRSATTHMKRALLLWGCAVYWAVNGPTRSASGGCEGVEMVSRESWGARPPRDVQSMEMPVPHVFVHHTATSSCNGTDSCSGILRAIQNFHMDDRGWNDIGYNFLIGGDGRAYVGRGWDRVGAHTYGFNRNSVAFSLVGNFVADPPPSDVLDAAKRMIRCACDQNYTTEDFRIHGHRDGVCTECPGEALYGIVKTWDRFEAGPLTGYRCVGK